MSMDLKNRLKNIKWFYSLYRKLIGNRRDEKSLKKNIDQRKKAMKESGSSIIQDIERVLSENNVDFFLGNGSLLGIVRDNKILDWDYDIDYGIYLSDEFGWDKLEKVLQSIGLKKYKEFYCNGELLTEQTYRFNDVYVDFFRHFDADNETFFYSYYKEKDKEYENENVHSIRTFNTIKLSGAKVINLSGSMYHIPNEAEEYLAGLYTDTWRIPNPNWVAGSGPACRKRPDLWGICKIIKEED